MRLVGLVVAMLVQGVVVTSDNSDLKFVQIVFRHGDRSPTVMYPNDPNNDKWPDGMGQLTTIGMEQQYELGAWLAKRYKGFLSPRYNRSEVCYRSDDEDRTIMSALSQLAGLYPPDDSQKFEESVNWQPVPVHVVATSDDLVVYDQHRCAEYQRLSEEVMQSDEVRAIAAENQDFVDFLSQHSGMNLSVGTVGAVYNPSNCERLHNMTQPDWLTDEVFERLRTLADLRWSWDFNSRPMIRLKMGVMINALVDNMKAVASSSAASSSWKLVAYSAHDTNLLGVLHALNVWNGRAVGYANCLLLELRHAGADDAEWTVTLHFRNESNPDGYRLTVPGCAEPCPLAQFEQLLADVNLSPANWTKECEAKEPAARFRRDANLRSTCAIERNDRFANLMAEVITASFWLLVAIVLGTFATCLLLFVFKVLYKCFKSMTSLELVEKPSANLYAYSGVVQDH